jgi:hypothetical protein
MANLNQTSCSHYVSYCLKNGFLVERDGGYELTGRAEQALSAVNLVLEKASELDSALERFASIVGKMAGEWGRSSTHSEGQTRAGTPFLGGRTDDGRPRVRIPARLAFSLSAGIERALADPQDGEGVRDPRTPTPTSSSQIPRTGSEPPSGRQERFGGPPREGP